MQPDFGEAEADGLSIAPTRLRFGLMCRGLIFPDWQARCLEMLLDLRNLEPALVILDGRAGPPSRSSLWKKLGTLLQFKIDLFSLYKSYWVNRRAVATMPVDMSSAFAHVPRMTCAVVRKGKFSEYFQGQDLAAIRGYELDFVLRFGFNIIRGEILNLPRYGVWSYHHGDEQKYRGAPPCFWEIYHGQRETGCILQRLTERLDGGIVLKKGWFPTVHHSYLRNRDTAHLLGVPWPAQVCEDVLASRAGYLQNPPTPTTAPIYREPNNLQMIAFGLIQTKNSVRHLFHSLGAANRIASESAPIDRFR